jgi:arylsulfatase A-like enzyme
MELVEERTVTSIASQSYEWLTRTFLENYCLDVSQTAYVTANVYAAKAFDGQTGRHPFFELEEVWRTDWDEESGTIPAEAVTEAAKPYVDVENNESGPEKVIVHYMQPHFPSIPDPITEQQTPVEFGYTGQQIKFAWNKLQDREVSEQRVRESFQNNLRYVLESVEELVEESSGKVVLSSDHGQSFGEWGVYGHPPSTAMKQVLEVPWVVVQEPSKRVHEKTESHDHVDEKLAALGYK